MNKRYLIIFRGQVQGVGFRYTLIMMSRNYQVSGSIRNLSNGDVELQLQGEDKDLFLKKILTMQDPFIRIDDYSIKEIDPVEEKQGLTVHF